METKFNYAFTTNSITNNNKQGINNEQNTFLGMDSCFEHCAISSAPLTLKSGGTATNETPQEEFHWDENGQLIESEKLTGSCADYVK